VSRRLSSYGPNYCTFESPLLESVVGSLPLTWASFPCFRIGGDNFLYLDLDL